MQVEDIDANNGESRPISFVSNRSVNDCVENGGHIVNNSPNSGSRKVNGGIQRRPVRLLPGILQHKRLSDKALDRLPLVIHE